MIARIGAAAAAALLLASCGGDDGAGRYDAQVDLVRDAVAAGDRDAARTSLDQVGTDALLAHSEGEITDDELAQLASLVEQARLQLDEEVPPPTTTTEATTTTSAPPTTAAPAPVFDTDSEDREDKGEKKGKGRGGDDGDHDDDDD